MCCCASYLFTSERRTTLTLPRGALWCVLRKYDIPSTTRGVSYVPCMMAGREVTVDAQGLMSAMASGKAVLLLLFFSTCTLH